MNQIVHARFNPFEAVTTSWQVEQGRTVAEIVSACPDTPDWFWLDDPVGGQVCIDAVPIGRDQWAVTVPAPGAVVTLHGVMHGGGKAGSTKNILTTVAAVALVAGATLVSGGLLGPAAAGGLGILGASFAAGGLGANLAAAGLGLAATLLLSTLTPPPISNKGGGTAPQTSQAGIASNQTRLLEPLAAVLGRMRYSPLQLAPAFTTFENETITVHAIVGLAGHYDEQTIEDSLLVNGNEIDEFAQAGYQIRPGSPSDAVLTLIDYTVIEERRGTTLPNFVLEFKATKNDKLIHQDDPDRDLPQWQLYRTRGDADEIWIRLFWPGGIVRTLDDTTAFHPVRIEIRERGTSTWLKLPVIHFQSLNKARGSMRREIKLKWDVPGGPRINHDSDLDTFAAYSTTGDGEVIEYNAESYFGNSLPADQTPVMTNYTTSGVTMSASSEFSTSFRAWFVGDSNVTNFGWRPTLFSLPQWHKTQFASAKTIKSYMLMPFENAAPVDWYWEGSNDDAAWTEVARVTDFTEWDAGGSVPVSYWFQFDTPGSYIYYRLTVTKTNNGDSHPQIVDMKLCLDDAAGSNEGSIYASHVHLTNSGAEIYLDPATFPKGEYDVRIKRGLAAEIDNFNADNYTYSGTVLEANFFEYTTNSGNYVVEVGQSRFSSECLIEQFSTVEYVYPFNAAIHQRGVCMIAVKIPNLTIDSLSAIFHSIVPVFSGEAWSTDAPSSNPAALRRHVLLGQENALALPGEILNEEQHQDFYEFCAAEGHEFNAVIDGMSVLQVIDQVDAGGFGTKAFPNAQWGVIYEHDRSAETPVQVFAPNNTRFLTVALDLPKLPHAIRAEYLDEDDDWKVKDTLVYMDGYDANNATRIEAFTYPGFTDETKVEARALFDLRQLYLRPKKYTFEIGIEGLVAERGDLVSLIHDVTGRYFDYSRVKSIQTSGGDVTGLTLESRVNLGVAAGEVDTQMAAVIQVKDRTLTVAAVNETSETDTVTFVTPFAMPADELLAEECVVGFKLANFTTDHMIVKEIEFADLLTRRITLVDEARGLHA